LLAGFGSEKSSTDLVLTYFSGFPLKCRGAMNGAEEGVDKQAVDEIKRHFGIVVERLESKIELIAEDHALFRAEMKICFGELRSEIEQRLHNEVVVTSVEVAVGEVPSAVRKRGLRNPRRVRFH
jgi:hypothetical protein